MISEDKNKPVKIFTGISWEAEMLKNMLENDGIDAYMNNEIMGTLAPFYSNPGLGAVTLIVSSQDFEKAKIIVQEFEKGREK